MVTAKEARRAIFWNRLFLLVLGLLAILALVLFLRYRIRHTFTPAQWHADPSQRVELVKDLLNRYHLTGMTLFWDLRPLTSPPASKSPAANTPTKTPWSTT